MFKGYFVGKYKFIEYLRHWGVAPIPHDFLEKIE